MRRAAIAIAAGLAVAAAVAAVARPTGGAAGQPRIVACEGAAALEFECFERRYVGLVQARGAAPALRDLARERARNGYVRAACHQLTHRAGRAAGAIDGIRAFDDGAPLCSSGYYHGVVEAVMARIGSARVIERAADVCAQLRERERRSADHYNCAHGMGHGFMGSFASDVFASLRGCDALADGWERRQCYGGVFMENLSAIGHRTRPPTALRPREPLYPCTAVARRYREACFDKQTTYALYVTDSDFARVFALCSRVERAFRGACYRGLGGDIAVDAAKHVFEPRAQARSRTRLCRLGPGREARRQCVVGVVRVTLRDLAGGAAQTDAFCRALGSGDLRRVCVRARAAAYRELPLHDTLLASPSSVQSVQSVQSVHSVQSVQSVRISLTLVALLFALTGCGGDDPAPSAERADGKIERFTVRGQAAVLIAPTEKTPRVVVYTHGSGERVDNIFRDPKKEPIFNTLLGAGYAIATTDAHGDNWGSPASERDQRALVDELRERGLGDVYVLALSMGGFNGLQLLDDVPVKAWAGIFPACDLRSVYDLGLYPDQIRAGYDRTGRRLGDAIARRSPVDFDPPDGLPMRFWASPGDRVIPKRENTDRCSALAREGGARVEVTTTSGDHGDPSNYDAEGVLRLFESADG